MTAGSADVRQGRKREPSDSEREGGGGDDGGVDDRPSNATETLP